MSPLFRLCSGRRRPGTQQRVGPSRRRRQCSAGAAGGLGLSWRKGVGTQIHHATRCDEAESVQLVAVRLRSAVARYAPQDEFRQSHEELEPASAVGCVTRRDLRADPVQRGRHRRAKLGAFFEKLDSPAAFMRGHCISCSVGRHSRGAAARASMERDLVCWLGRGRGVGTRL